MNNSIFFRFSLLIGIMFNVIFVQGQEQTVKTDTTKKAPEIQIIPIDEIPNEIPKASAEIRNIRLELVPDSVLYFQKERLDTFLLNFKSFQDDQQLRDTGISVNLRLENQLYLWNKQKSTLENIKNEVQTIQDNLNSQKESFNKILSVWEESKKTIEKEADIPENLMPVINDFLKNANLVNDTINQKNAIVFDLLKTITETTIAIDENISDKESDLRSTTSRQLTTKEPSLIKAILKPQSEIKIFGNVGDNLKRSALPLKDFVNTKLNIILLYLLFLLTLIVFFVYVKKNLNKDKYKEQDKRLVRNAVIILNKPIATSLLIALLFSLLIFPDAPVIVRQITYLLLVIPLMVLIPKLVDKKLRSYIYGIGILFILYNYIDLAIYKSVGEYILEILIAIIVFYGLLKVNKKEILQDVFLRKSTQVTFGVVFSIFMIFLVIGIVATIIGYYILGSFLILRVVVSLYVVILFFTGYQIIAGFFELTLHLNWVRNFHVFKSYHDQINKWFISLLYTFTILFFFYTLFFIFGIKEEIVDAIVSVWNFGFDSGELNFTIGNVSIFFFTLWITILLSKIISAVLEQDVLRKLRLKRGVPKTISTLAKYAIITIGFLVAIAAAGFKLQNLTIIISAFGVGIGFGLQDVINNFISGLILLFERPIQVGDSVQVGTLWGKVEHIGIRSSIIRTFDGSEVIVPNGMLISQEVTNWTLSDSKRRLELKVGVAYGSDLNKVLEILLKCATDNEGVMEDPAPAAWFTGFGDSSIDFRLVFWHPNFDGGLTVVSQVGLAIDTALKKASITIPFPQRDLYIKEVKDTTKQEDQVLKKTVPKKTPPKK